VGPHLPVGDHPLLSVVKPFVRALQMRTLEDLDRVLEIDPVFAEGILCWTAA
jgi:hypothetical protein